MQAIRSILVVIQPHLAENLALKRAKLISGVTQSHLHLLVCEKAHDHQADLDALAKSLTAEGFSVSTQQSWLNNMHETVIAAQQAEGCELVIKQHLPDNPLKKLVLTPSDWKLLRYSPVPVLMVKSAKAWTNGNVLAAVDAGNADGDHRALHTSIISYAFDITELAQGTLHVLSAHPSPMLSAADPTFQLQDTIAARYKANCKSFMYELELNPDCLHIEEGPADVLIPFTAKKLNAVLTVIGTVARKGLAGTLIGNTAEVILDALDSDVLVLKPDDVLDHLENLIAQH
jgi:universal stress protein E